MELDDMKSAWLALDRRLERQEALNLHTFRDRPARSPAREPAAAADRPHRADRRRRAARARCSRRSGSSTSIRRTSSSIGASLQRYALMLIIGGARDIYLVRRIDYAAPVLEIQRRLTGLRAWLLRERAGVRRGGLLHLGAVRAVGVHGAFRRRHLRACTRGRVLASRVERRASGRDAARAALGAPSAPLEVGRDTGAERRSAAASTRRSASSTKSRRSRAKANRRR